MNCVVPTKTNGQDSILFKSLTESLKNPSLTENKLLEQVNKEYNFLTNDSENSPIINIFGDYLSAYKSQYEDDFKEMIDRVDENGEPILFKDEQLDRTFILDKNGERFYFPFTKSKLNILFTNEQLAVLTKSLALSFYENNIDSDFDNFIFTNKKDSKTLKDFIELELNKIHESLMKSDSMIDVAKGMMVKGSLNNINQWEDLVIDFFKSIKIDIDAREEYSITMEEDSIRGELINTASFEKSYKTSINNDIKLYLSLFKNVKRNKDGKLEYVLNEFNQPTFVLFDDIFSTLNKSLSNVVAVEENGQFQDEYDIYLNEIKRLSKIKPFFELVYNDLKDKEDSFKNKFVAAFRLHKNNFLGSEAVVVEDLRTKEKTFSYIVRNLSEVGSRKSNILLQWYFNFQNNTEPFKVLKEQFKGAASSFSSGKMKRIKTDKEAKAAISKLRSDLSDLGVNTTVQGFDFFINDLVPDKVSDHKEVANKIYKTYYAIEKAVNSFNPKDESNIFLDQSIFKEISEAEAFFMEETSDASIFSMNKTKWAYSNPSALSLKVESWKKNPLELLELYKSKQGVYRANSLFIPYYLDLDENGNIKDINVAKERLSKLETYIFNSLQEENDSINGVDNNDISYKDSLVDYLNKVLADKPYHKTALAADNSTEIQLHYGIPNISAGLTFSDGKIKGVSQKSIDIIFGYFMDELNRARQVAKEIDLGENLLPNYHLENRNGLKIQILPELNNNVNIFDSKGIPYDELSNETIAQIKIYIKNELIKKIEETSEELLDLKILEIDNSGILKNNNIDENIFNKYKTYNKNAYLAISGDLFLNNVISQIEYAKLFTGDVAYYKTFVDYQKRGKSLYTDGLYARVKDGQENFNVSVIESVEISDPFLDYMKEYLPEKIWKKYEKVNTTDAQAWITPQRWKFLLEGLGKWSKDHESAYKKMNSSNPNYNEKELKVLAQPLKGVYFDVKEGVPVYLKYSQAVLIPNLIKGNSLETLYNQMTKDENGKDLKYEDQIHELLTKDAIKVGYPQPDVSHDSKGKVRNDFKITNKTKLNNKYWKLQQDLPTKGVKLTDVGSQIQKNIFQGLSFHVGTDVRFDLKGQEFTAEEMISKLNNVVNALGNKGLISVINELGINPDTFKIENEDALYDSIIDQLLKRNDVPDNVIKALRAKTSPYAIPNGLDLFQNVFSSIVNNRIVKIKTNGGGFIQMADYGITKNELNKTSGVIYAPWFDKKYDRLHPPVLEKSKDGSKPKLQPGGIFISGNLIAKYIPNYTSYSTEQLFGSPAKVVNGKLISAKEGIIDQRILRKIVGYRIPNQGLPSNDALQVLGILPAGVADTVVAYAGITKKTGSDFDIDKMYLMLPSFEVEAEGMIKKGYDFIFDYDISNKEIIKSLKNIGMSIDLENDNIDDLKKIFIRNILINNYGETSYHKDFYDNYKFENIKLKYIPTDLTTPFHEKSKEELQNLLIEIYQSVLTNIDNIEDIMNPLDDPIIEDDIKNLNPEENLKSFEAFDAINSLKTKDKFRSAKQGLGQAVNYTMDFVRGSMGEIGINGLYIYDWTNENENNGQVGFDQEFSKELTEDEINYYIESYNERLDSVDSDSPRMTREKFDNLGLAKIKISKSLIALSNGFVDVANNPFIVNGNWVTQTNNLGLMLIRAGIHPFKVNAFLNSKILKDYISYKNVVESKTNLEPSNYVLQDFLIEQSKSLMSESKFIVDGKEYDGYVIFNSGNVKNITEKLINEKPVEDAVNVLAKIRNNLNKNLFKIKRKLTPEDNAQIDKAASFVINQMYDLVPYDRMGDYTFKDLRDSEFLNDMKLNNTILKAFLNLNEYAKVMSKNVGASRVDVDGKGKDIGSLVSYVNRINEILINEGEEGQMFGFNTKLYQNRERTPLSVAIRNGLIFSYKVMRNNPKYFLQANDTVLRTFDMISYHIKNEPAQDQSLLDKLQKEHYVYLMSGFSPLNLNSEERKKLIKEMPERFKKIKSKYKTNELLKELYLKPGKGKNFFIAMPNLKKPVSIQNAITNSFIDLLDKEKEFAEDLIKYSYLMSGFVNSLTQFHQYIPFEWLNENRINSYFKSLDFSKLDVDVNFIDQVFRNNTSDNRFFRSKFVTDVVRVDKKISPFTAVQLRDKLNRYEYPPYMLVVIDNSGRMTGEGDVKRIYTLAGEYSPNSKPVYIRTSKLGDRDGKGNNIKEYMMSVSSLNNTELSIFPSNNLSPKGIKKDLIDQLINSSDVAPYYIPGAFSQIDSNLTSLIERNDAVELGMNNIDFKKC